MVCQLFKITKRSAVSKVQPELEIPLELMNSDIIRRDKLIRRIGSSGQGRLDDTTSTGCDLQPKKKQRSSEGDTRYCPLSAFRLIASVASNDEVTAVVGHCRDTISVTCLS